MMSPSLLPLTPPLAPPPLASLLRPPPAAAISLRELAEPENSLTHAIDGEELRLYDRAPAIEDAPLIASAGDRSRVSLSQLLNSGSYVVLFFLPGGPLEQQRNHCLLYTSPSPRD